MTVLVNDVRIALNNLSDEELDDQTILQKIQDATVVIGSKITTPLSSDLLDIAIKYYAAYLSFIVSDTFQKAHIGPLNVERQKLEKTADALKKSAEEALENAKTSRMKIKQSFMYATRDEDVPDRSELPSDAMGVV